MLGWCIGYERGGVFSKGCLKALLGVCLRGCVVWLKVGFLLYFFKYLLCIGCGNGCYILYGCVFNMCYFFCYMYKVAAFVALSSKRGGC